MIEKIQFKTPTPQELVLLHDFYFRSTEPDAPTKIFSSLDSEETAEALAQYNSESHLVAREGERVLGFVGIFPDDESMFVGIFYVIDPIYRGMGYLSPILNALAIHCREKYPDYKFIRVLTRKENLASIK